MWFGAEKPGTEEYIRLKTPNCSAMAVLTGSCDGANIWMAVPSAPCANDQSSLWGLYGAALTWLPFGGNLSQFSYCLIKMQKKKKRGKCCTFLLKSQK